MSTCHFTVKEMEQKKKKREKKKLEGMNKKQEIEGTKKGIRSRGGEKRRKK